MFGRDRTTILRHINNIFKTKELNKKEVCANFAHTTQQEMAYKSNVLRDKIAKIERGIYSPNIKSLLKILGPLGYTIKIEKIKEEINE